jgi:uncharacterized protein (TIGR02145 family)
MKTNLSRLPQFIIIAAIIFLSVTNLSAQVTVGSDIAPTRAALLDLKTRQINGIPAAGADQDNYTTKTGGLLLPRVVLEGDHSLAPFLTAEEETDSLKRLLTGLMVYNITTAPPSLYPAVYTWDGGQWKTSETNEVEFLVAASQPAPFTFCEDGSEDVTLTFNVNGGVNPQYQWFQITSTNVHVRVGDTIKTDGIGSGYKTKSLKLGSSILRGVNSTKEARYCGLYKFYCVVTDDVGQRVESNTSEVAVGCGAKNNVGDWLSFMCFNLGADNSSTIASQTGYFITFQNDSTSNEHPYTAGEESLYGSLFQWGRIADGHEKRSFNGVTRADSARYSEAALTPAIQSGNLCTTTNLNHPVNQVHIDSVAWYGKFITGSSNWNPLSSQADLDRLWLANRYLSNDPCTHYKTDGTYQPFWYTNTTGNAACTDANTGWRLPTQEELSALYKGGTTSGNRNSATANTWVWNGATSYPGNGKLNVTKGGGFEIRPDGITATLFLPASGARAYNSGLLTHAGAYGRYWSSSLGTAANGYPYHLSFNSGTISSGNTSGNRANGYAIRCIKHT